MAAEELDSKDVKKKLKAGPNNSEHAGEFVTKLTAAMDLFESRIHSYDRYETELAYPEFVDTYLELFSEVEDYYDHTKASIVLDTIEDKMAKMLQMETTHKKEQAKCPNPVPTTSQVDIRC